MERTHVFLASYQDGGPLDVALELGVAHQVHILPLHVVQAVVCGIALLTTPALSHHLAHEIH